MPQEVTTSTDPNVNRHARLQRLRSVSPRFQMTTLDFDFIINSSSMDSKPVELAIQPIPPPPDQVLPKSEPFSFPSEYRNRGVLTLDRSSSGSIVALSDSETDSTSPASSSEFSDDTTSSLCDTDSLPSPTERKVSVKKTLSFADEHGLSLATVHCYQKMESPVHEVPRWHRELSVKTTNQKVEDEDLSGVWQMPSPDYPGCPQRPGNSARSFVREPTNRFVKIGDV